MHFFICSERNSHTLAVVFVISREMDRAIANKLSPEALASLDNVIREFHLNHQTDLRQIMRDWNLVDDNLHRSDHCLSDCEPFQDSSERLRSLLHFLYESATYRDLTSASTASGGRDLVPTETTWRYKVMLDQVLSQAENDLLDDLRRWHSLSPLEDEWAQLLQFHPIYDAFDVWEHPRVPVLKAQFIAMAPWCKIGLRYCRILAASEMLSVFNKALELFGGGFPGSPFIFS